MAEFVLTGEYLVVVKLIIAALFGGILGYTREKSPVKMRTLALICVGATIFTVISVNITGGTATDPGRIMAQIVTGIGFLGAGVIWKSKEKLSGLTTAAAIWTMAGLGMLIGLSMWVTAIAGLLVTFVILKAKKAEKKIMNKKKKDEDDEDD